MSADQQATSLVTDATTLYTIGDFGEAAKLWGKAAGLLENADKHERATVARRASDRALEELAKQRSRGEGDSEDVDRKFPLKGRPTEEWKNWEWNLDEATERFCDKYICSATRIPVHKYC